MQIDPGATLFGQRFANLMSELIGGHYEVFLREPVVSTESGEIGNNEAPILCCRLHRLSLLMISL